MEHPLQKLIQLQKQGKPVGIYSACSANKLVLQACIERAKQTNSIVLIEATSNQVDQFGGYTQMTPKDFYKFTQDIASEINYPMDNIILGGDHLGPLTFSNKSEEEAMKLAEDLVYAYVLAGFTKIHLDTSMKLNDDAKDVRLSDEIIAKRGARLAFACEKAFKERQKEFPNTLHPIYIVGSEVPIPGGSTNNADSVQVTKVEDFKSTLSAFEKAFSDAGVKDAWNYVIAVVVQPGLEEKDDGCVEYERNKAIELTKSIKDYDNLVFEGHSTDYQTRDKLKQLVEDGVAILKVGPGLTFSMREAIYSLAKIEDELFDKNRSNIIDVLDSEMVKEPKYWTKHYHGDENKQAFARKYSFSDRSRYYWTKPEVVFALQKLIDNLNSITIPNSLLSQYMPIQYTKIRNHELDSNPEALIKDRIINTIDDYLFATNQQLIK